jgi:protein TonB
VFRWSLAVAVVVHGLLLALPMPTGTVDAGVAPPARPVFRVVNRPPAPPEPPEPLELPEPPAGPVVTIPVPEIDDPEPLSRDEEPLPTPDPAVADLDSTAWDGILDAPPPPAEPGNGPVHVIGDIVPPETVHAPRPRYPEAAHRIGRNGLVVLQAVIDREGRVREVKVLRGAPLGMTEAAVDAVRGWRFRPATRDGEPVAVYYQLTVRFRRLG